MINQIISILDECYEEHEKTGEDNEDAICCLLLSSGHIVRGIPVSKLKETETVAFRTGSMTEINVSLAHVCAAWHGDATDSGISLFK